KSPVLKLESEREHLSVGEARDELPPPFTRPAAQGGVLDPEDLPAQLQIVIPPWPGMHVDQKLHIFWRASVGLDYYDFMLISAPMLGKEVVFFLDRGHVEANLGAIVDISYRVETPGEADQVSAVTTFLVDSQEQIDSGPLRVMGGRSTLRTWFGRSVPRMLTALHDETLQPMIAAWRYEDSQQWTAASTWIDTRPTLKLYVRSESETWECRALNIVGNGVTVNHHNGSAFVAMRDEVEYGDDLVVDVVAWGDPSFGGALDADQIALDNVAEIHSTGHAFAARLRTGDVACWGNPAYGGSPAMVYGDFVQIQGGTREFVGRKRDGDLFGWGESPILPIPQEVLQHKDYVDLDSTNAAFAALRESGHVVAWGDPGFGGELRQGQERFDDIVQILGGTNAFIALRDFGTGRSVIGWGNGSLGGLIPQDIAPLTNVRQLGATTGATFCIILDTGEVKAWPLNQNGGTIPDNIAQLTNVVEVTSTIASYCARLSNGKVVAWGHTSYGGDLPEEVERKSDIVQVTSNASAFAALSRDGTVVAWGRPEAGGDTSTVAAQLKDVQAIYACSSAFAALTADGRVVTWGAPGGGGNSGHVQPELTGHVTARRLLSPEEAAAVVIPRRRGRRSRR
ncbi:RCC1 domain-containing protein, partial [Pseudomonas japonica]|uniref:RCC1 domain-containing protein n=1 Tax=Pseudomonas japonica TaxID=256466 RepID=UPI0037F41259